VTDGETLETGAAAWSVQLPQFEGPLDLLLHLCQKHEIDILKINIGELTEKYLAYLDVMQLMELDVAAEYLVMAATLAHIKSKMLLPAPPPGQDDDPSADVDEIDPREALVRRLLEYQKYKLAAEQLSARGVSGRDVFGRGMPVEEAEPSGLPPLAEVPIFSLVDAFQRVLDRSKVKLSHDIVADRLSLSDRIAQLADLLTTRGRLRFEDLFENLTNKFDLVITFLALLEMTKLRMTRLYQAEPYGPLHVELAAGAVSNEIEEAPAAPGSSAPAHAEPAAEHPNEAAGAAAERPRDPDGEPEHPDVEPEHPEDPDDGDADDKTPVPQGEDDPP
jgi:segregation and condensation protein A